MRVFGQAWIPTACVLLVLSGCSIINPKGDEYKHSTQLPPLEIPPQLSKPQSDDRYAIPDPKDVASSATYSEYAKNRGLPTIQNGYVPGVGVDPKTAKAHIERNGSDRWLVVNGSPDQVYNFVRSYLVEAGYKLSVEKPEIGVIETDWMEVNFKVDGGGLLSNLFGNMLNTDDTANFRDRYAIRVDPGKEKGTVEVYVSHKGVEEVALGLDNFKWQPRPSDPEKEAEMLKTLMVKFGADADKAAQQAGVTPKEAKKKAADKPAKQGAIAGALVDREGGDSAIRINDAFDRAWRQAGVAIDKTGLVVTDQNRQDGVFYVQYDASKIKGEDPFNPDKSSGGVSGWFRSLFGGSEKKAAKPDPQSSAVSFEDKSSYKVLVLKRDEMSSEIVVQDRDGKKLPPALAKRFLSILLNQQLN